MLLNCVMLRLWNDLLFSCELDRDILARVDQYKSYSTVVFYYVCDYFCSQEAKFYFYDSYHKTEPKGNKKGSRGQKV